jgi:thioredoxin reductase (NADPH)
MYKIYTKDNCSWCIKAKKLLDDVGVKYTVLNLDTDYTKEQLRELIGPDLPLTAPQVFVYDKRIGGYEDLAEYMEMHNITGLQT